MAKNNKAKVEKEEEVQSPDTTQGETPTEPTQDNTPDDTDDVEEKAPVVKEVASAKVNTTKVKEVEVRYLEDGTCIVAQKTYKCKKNTTAKVPMDVAAILVNGGVAIRI